MTRLQHALNAVENTAEIIDMRYYFIRKTFYNRHFLDAWKLHDRYAARYQADKKAQDLRFAQQWMNTAIFIGDMIERNGGGL